MRTMALAMAILMGTSGIATAAVKSQVVEYKQGAEPWRLFGLGPR